MDDDKDPLGALMSKRIEFQPERIDPESDPLGAAMYPRQAFVPDILKRAEEYNWDFANLQSKLAEFNVDAEPYRKQFETRAQMQAERERQGTGVTTLEQIGRKPPVPFLPSVLEYRRTNAYDAAAERLKKGEATKDDYETIARHERHKEADAEVKKTAGWFWGGALGIAGDAPAIVYEAKIAGKALGAAGRAFGIGKSTIPAGEAVHTLTKPGVVQNLATFGGKQALVLPAMPSMYLTQAQEINQREGRRPDDIRGFVPAVGLGYANVMVLGSLQKFGNRGSFGDQIVQKGAIGVGEQAIVDVGTGLADEFINKGWKLGTKYGVLGDLARGDVGKGLEHATLQMLTFSYFAGLHGKQPDRVAEAYRAALAAEHKRGFNGEAAGRSVGLPGVLIQDATRRNPDMTQGEARAVLAEATKKLKRPMSEETRNYGEVLADTLPERPSLPGRRVSPERFGGGVELARPGTREAGRLPTQDRGPATGAVEAPGRVENRIGTAAETKGRFIPGAVEPMFRAKERGPAEPPAPIEQPSLAMVEPVAEKAPEPTLFERVKPEDLADLAKQLSNAAKKGQTVKVSDLTKPQYQPILQSIVDSYTPKAPETAPASPPVAERTPERPITQPEPIAPPAQSEAAKPQLLPGVKSGKADHQGNPLTRHDVADSSGKVVGDVSVFQSGGTLHIHWGGGLGQAGGEGRGKSPFGGRAVVDVFRQLAEAYPDAVVAKYTPAEGRIKAGEVKWVDLEKIRQRGEIQDRRAQQTEDGPQRRAGDQPSPAAVEPARTVVAEKVAADREAPFVAPPVNAKATAERRSFPFKAKPVTNPQGKRAEVESEERLKPGESSLPPEMHLRLKNLGDKIKELGVDASQIGKMERKAADLYRQYGQEGYDSVVAHYEARYAEKLAELEKEMGGKVVPREESTDEVIERELREDMDKVSELQEEINREVRFRTEERTRIGLKREAAERLAKEPVRQANEVADVADQSIRPAKAAGKKQPRPEASKDVDPEKKLLADFAAKEKDAEAKDYLESALHNYAPDAGAKPGDRKRAALVALSISLTTAYTNGKPQIAATVRNAMERLGGRVYGPRAGKTAEFDGKYYESREPVSSGEKVKVVNEPITLAEESGREFIVRKGRVEPVKAESPREKTIIDDVIEKGGIRWDSAMEAHFETQGEAREYKLDRPGLFVKGGRGESLDTMAQAMKMTPQELVDALKEGRTSRVQDNTEFFDAEARRNDAERERAARDRGEPAEEWKDTGEEIPFSRGGRPADGSTIAGDGSPVKGPFEIIAEQNKLFGVKNYVEKRIAGAPKNAGAAAFLEQRATVTQKQQAGEALVNLEEHAHHLQKEFGLSSDPAVLPAVVARGISQFFAPRSAAYGLRSGTLSKTAMVEGFADWVVMRSTDNLKKLSHEQQVANEYLERWAAEKGLTERFDQVREMYRRLGGQSEATKAAMNVSATGEPAKPDTTLRERAGSVLEKAEGAIENDLAVLLRAGRDAEARGAEKGIAKRIYDFFSNLMYADKARAGEFERDGVHTYIDGRKQVIGLPLERITDGAKPEWLAPNENGGASRAGTYALARHVLGEEARGRVDLVSSEQLEQYRRAMSEFKADADFITWAEPFANRLTDAFNATRRALAGKDVHFLTPEQVKEWEKKYPDYIPTDRVMQDAGWRTKGGTRGELPGKVTGERSGSGEQIMDPLISYKKRLKITSAVMGKQLKDIEGGKLLSQKGMGDYAIRLNTEELNRLGKTKAEQLAALGLSGKEIESVLPELGKDLGEVYYETKPFPRDGTKPTWGFIGPGGEIIAFRMGDKPLYDLLTGQQVEANALARALKPIGDFIKPMTDVVKFGATTASLGFQFRNIPRDIYSFWQNTVDRLSVKNLPDAYKRAYAYAWAQLTGKVSGDQLFSRFVKDRGDELRQFSFEKSDPYRKIEDRRTIWGVMKDVLNVAGAGELAPRFLEWKTRLQQTTGKTEAELVKELDAAEKSAQEGKHVPDPIPLAIALDAMTHAAEVTTPFSRLGTVTREVNKITPFFGPAIAGLSKQLRNWQSNPKGAAFALAGLLGLRLLHWLTYSDEEWYKELSANDRYNNFVVPTPAGLRRFPAPRGLEVAGGGFLTAALDAAAEKKPDFKGFLKQSIEGNTPPLPLPPVAKVGLELAANQNWMGSPIVPRRDEDADRLTKLKSQVPYAADQLTGGLVSGRKIPEKATDLLPYGEVKNANRSVGEFYDEMKSLEQERSKATRQGLRYADEKKYQKYNDAQRKLADLNRAARGERLVNGRVVSGEQPSSERKAELRAQAVQVAKKALGR